MDLSKDTSKYSALKCFHKPDNNSCRSREGIRWISLNEYTLRESLQQDKDKSKKDSREIYRRSSICYICDEPFIEDFNTMLCGCDICSKPTCLNCCYKIYHYFPDTTCFMCRPCTIIAKSKRPRIYVQKINTLKKKNIYYSISRNHDPYRS